MPARRDRLIPRQHGGAASSDGGFERRQVLRAVSFRLIPRAFSRAKLARPLKALEVVGCRTGQESQGEPSHGQIKYRTRHYPTLA